MNQARSEAVLLHCQDPRFRFHVEQLVAAQLGIGLEDLDALTVPGAGWVLAQEGENTSLVMRGLEIAIKSHGARRVQIVHHEDCGAYGGSCMFENFDKESKHHENDMRKAAHMIVRRFPHIQEIQGFIARKNGHVTLQKVMG